MKKYILIVLLLMPVLTSSADALSCQFNNQFNLSSTMNYKGYTITYSQLLESISYPEHYLDPLYTITPPGGSYRASYNGNLWAEIITPDFTLSTYFLNNDNSTIIDFCVINDIPPTPTPTPTPTSTLPGTSIGTVTGTATGTAQGGGFGDYQSYDENNPNGTYSHIPANSHGINEGLKGAGYCKSGTCTGGDIVSFLKSYINAIFWLSFFGAVIRFLSFSEWIKGLVKT